MFDIDTATATDAPAKIISVLRHPRYALIGALAAFTAYALYALLLNHGLILTTLASGEYGLITTLLPTLILGYAGTTTALSITLTVMVALLVGVNVALVAFRLTELASLGRQDASSLGGMLVAVAAPACPACATAIFAVAGGTSLFAILPFKGTEIKVLALLLLVGSAVWMTAQLDQDHCEFC